MRDGKSINLAKYMIILIVAAAVLYFLMLGPPNLLAKSESPIFCGGCHVMDSEYEAWSHAGAHRRKKCVDCHLPHQNTAIHYVSKSMSGIKDAVFFYSGQAPEHIEITERGKKILQDNCIRCHETTIGMIGQERQCWDCHRRIAHKRTGAMLTI